ncbi:hypothetical protein IC582_017540 [Cucumis melo]|uniref:Trypsin inhibitor 1 n=2 Tax=Cucumis melo TaxID=3656 RepID=A0A5D3E0W0_CUCMM|nr:Trypsin inhibitor 1 [Cucumis melo var. makuwa]TYK29464.1 Trypsin inhibitor 1 [Cucumis melo var. makuwa]
MEWKKIALVAMMGMLLMATFTESVGFGVDEEIIQLVSDGVNEYSGHPGCPRILMKCKTDRDCLAGCTCKRNGYCG